MRRHYFGHWSGLNVMAPFPFDLNIWYGAMVQSVEIDDWGDHRFDHSGLGFIGGTGLHVSTEKHPIASAAMNTFRTRAGLGIEMESFVRENAGRWVSAYLQTTTFPYENTYPYPDPEVRDLSAIRCAA